MALAPGPYAPLAEVGPEDSPALAPLLQGGLDQVKEINFVNDELKTSDQPATEGDTSGPTINQTVRQYCENFVWDIVRRTKTRRLPLEDRWLSIQRMVALDHDGGQMYKGRSNAYVPMYARNRKTLVSAMSRGLFPSDEYMDVVDRQQGMSEDAKAAKEVVRYEFEHSGLRRTIKAFLGQYADFGVSCLKGFYRKGSIFNGPSMPDETGSVPDGEDDGVQFATRSMFNMVMYPEWAESKRDFLLEAERLEVPMPYVNAMHAMKRWENVAEALSFGSNHSDTFDWINATTLSDVASIPNTFELRGRDGSPVQAVIVVEVWTSMPIPDKFYTPDERKGAPVPVRVVFVNGIAVQARRNPFKHQKSPFLYARDNQIAGSFYGDGAGHLSRDTQYLVNDVANQVNDCASYGMNPVALVNTNYFAGKVDALKPGRVYKGRDIDKMMKFDRPPVEIIQYGQTHLQSLMAMGQDAGGAPPVLQGAKSAGTATGTQILQNNAQNPLQDAVEDIENDVMVPAMKMAFALSQQYREQEFIRKLDDGSLVRFFPRQIEADLEFRFLASSQAVNRQQRQQGLMTFTELAEKLGPNLQLQGKMLNPTVVLQRAWNDGLGNRGFDQVIVPLPPPPGVPPGMAGPGQPGAGPPGMPPGGPGGPPPPGMPPPGAQGPSMTQHPPVSAVPQGNVPGAQNNEPVPGEGSTLHNIRQQVQQSTAMQGALNVPGGGPGAPVPGH